MLKLNHNRASRNINTVLLERKDVANEKYKKSRICNQQPRENLLKNKSAFTLIELLSIIIILAIISVITIPIILNVIDKAKQGTIIDSAYGYLKAIDNFYIEKITSDDNEIDLNGIYLVNNGNLGEHNILVNGSIPKSGRLLYENNELISGTLQFDDYVALIYENQIKVKKGTFDLQILPYEQQTQENKLDGLYNSEYDTGRLLYRGYNPNNYIWLDENGDAKRQDEELYRIISFENDDTIKVVRKNSIGVFKWDFSTWRNYENNSFCDNLRCNSWGNENNTYYQDSTLKSMYNGFHYKYYVDNNNALTLNSNDNSLNVIQDSYINSMLNGEWLNRSKISKYITEHYFNVNGIYYSITVKNKSLKTEKQEQGLYNWKGKIGLLNITDIVEASLSDNCTSVWNNYTGNSNNSTIGTDEEWPCHKKNYISKYNEYTMTPFSTNSIYVWYSNYLGAFAYSLTDVPRNIRPSFFLRKDLVFYGEGTKNNPYIIENFDK